MSKQCTKCLVTKPSESFEKRADSKDGLRNHCLECRRQNDKLRWFGERKDKNQKRLKEYYKQNWQHCRDINKKYMRANKGLINSIQAKRRAAKLCATPSWLTKQHYEAIKSLYKQAANLKMHVDHIIPLQGKDVSGLHVPWNLQLLPSQINLKKSNKIILEHV